MAFSYDSGFTYDSGATYGKYARTSITFDDSVTLSARGQLVGVSKLSFGNVAKIEGEASIFSSSSLVFTSYARIIGLTYISGTSNLEFIPHAFLSKTGRVRGNTSLTFDTIPLLTGRGNIFGNSTLTTTVGDVTAFGIGNMISETPVSFNLIGTMKATGKLIGASSYNFDIFPKLTGRGALKSPGINLQFTTEARLEIKVPVFGLTSFNFDQKSKLRRSPFSGSKSTTITNPYGTSSGTGTGLFLETSSNTVTTPYSLTEE